MGCYHPLKGFVKRTTSSGRTEIIVTPYSVDHLEIDYKGRIKRANTPIIGAACKLPIRRYYEIPCGKCIGCRLEYSRQWANRCALEMKQHDENCFITLTYDDDHLPMASAVDGHDIDIQTGEIKKIYSEDTEVATLHKEDLQNFMKGLRRKVNEIPKEKRKGNRRYYHDGDPEYINLRYFACGEYGDNTHRPHMHICLFGWMPDDVCKYMDSELGFTYYTSDTLNKVWKNGFAVVSEASWETAAYTARYVVKKVRQLGMDFYEMNGVEPPFLLMSRRPGIGKTWYDNDKKCYAIFSEQYIATEKGPRKISSNRYFDNLLKDEYPFDFDIIKQNRESLEHDRKKFKSKLTTKDYLKQLETEEELIELRTKSLKRKGGEHYKKIGQTWTRQEDF